MNEQITNYFVKLRQSPHPTKWPYASYNKAPYKPLLLLAILDLFDQGEIQQNLIKLTPDLGELFQIYCNLILPSDQNYNIAMPFYHLTGDGFWKLIALPGQEAVVQSGKVLSSVSLLQKTVWGARLDDALYTLMCNDHQRSVLRSFLIANYFREEIHQSLVERSLVNHAAFEYSIELLETARQKKKADEKKLKEAQANYHVRDQGFRRAIVIAYQHQCAFCGIRILTPDGHTSVDAAHIIPWSETHDDEPSNGMALCKLCHWSFDEGLLTVNNRHLILVSPQLSASQNIPNHLVSLSSNPIYKPNEEQLWPKNESLTWHQQKIFRKY